MKVIKKFHKKGRRIIRIYRKGEFAQITFAWLPALGGENYWVSGKTYNLLSELRVWIADNEIDIEDYLSMSNDDAEEGNFYGADYWQDKCRYLLMENNILQAAIDNLEKLIKLGHCRVYA